jgi:transcriptional regulator with XRE-family HTH domain
LSICFFGISKIFFGKRTFGIDFSKLECYYVEKEVIFVYSERVESCGRRIAKALDIKGIKQTDLCRLAKIPKSSLSLYLSGAYEPKQDRIYAIATVLGVSEAWLMGYDVPMERQKQSPDKQELSEGEKILLDLFKKVPEDQQQLVLQMIRAALRSQEQ